MTMSEIAHLEFAGRGGERLEAFYRDLFGWTFRKEGGDYSYWKAAIGSDDGLTVGIRHEPEGPPEMIPYFRVEDVGASASKAEELGGSVRIAPTSTPEFIFAVVLDPDGNGVGLIQPLPKSA
jgi:predicted enzyme related to lactoylglutathione lyase